MPDAPEWRGLPPSFLPSGDTTGATDTTAFLAALAALPTRTVFAIPATNGGASAAYPVGTIRLGSGDYHIGGAQDIGNIGPFVNVIGNGRNATRVFYHGSGDCLRMLNAVFPADDNFDDIAAWHGRIDGLDIDGTFAQPGARGIHYGDTEGGVLGPDLMIRNFTGGRMAIGTLSLGAASGGGTFAAGTYFWKVTAIGPGGETWGSNEVSTTLTLNQQQVLNWTAVANATGYRIYRATSSGNEKLVATVGNVTTYTDTGTAAGAQNYPTVNATGGIGLWLDNTVSWTENLWTRVSIYNCDNSVIVERSTGDSSFEYNELDVKCYCLPGQNGVVVRNGAALGNGSLKIRANMGQSSSSISSAAVLSIGGQSGGFFSTIANQRLDIQAESNNVGQGTAFGPTTIRFGGQFTGQNSIQNCVGIISFNTGLWTQSNWSWNVTKSNAFVFSGVIRGDTNLHPSGSTALNPAALMLAGPLGYGQSIGFYSGAVLTFQNQIGDVLTGTLTQNTTIGFNETMGGPQRKTVILTQNATGGFTVTWPNPGSPTTAAPAIKWAGGAAPVMSPAANATDIYELVTADGATWYGRVIAQNVS